MLKKSSPTVFHSLFKSHSFLESRNYHGDGRDPWLVRKENHKLFSHGLKQYYVSTRVLVLLYSMYIIAIATNIEQKSLRNKTKEWALYRNHKGIGRNSQQSSNLNISKLIYQPLLLRSIHGTTFFFWQEVTKDCFIVC